MHSRKFLMPFFLLIAIRLIMQGQSFTTCRPIKGDSAATKALLDSITWQYGKDIGTLSGKTAVI